VITVCPSPLSLFTRSGRRPAPVFPFADSFACRRVFRFVRLPPCFFFSLRPHPIPSCFFWVRCRVVECRPVFTNFFLPLRMVWMCPAPCHFRGHGGFFDASAKSRISPNHFSPIAANVESRRAGNADFIRTLLIKPARSFDPSTLLRVALRLSKGDGLSGNTVHPGGAKGITQKVEFPTDAADKRLVRMLLNL